MQAQPVTTTRLPVPDILRGFAILAILIMNIPCFALPFNSFYDLRILNETNSINEQVWVYMMILLEGSMRAILSILFGAGVILLTKRLDKQNIKNLSAAIYYRRILLLLAFGLINAYFLLWSGDILFPYAIAGLFIFSFRNKSSAFLIRAFIYCMLIYGLNIYIKEARVYETRVKGLAAIEMQNKGRVLTEEQSVSLEKWNTYDSEHNLDGLKKTANAQTKSFRGGYGDVFKMVFELNIEAQTVFLYTFALWDYLGFMFLGMALCKMNILSGNQPMRFYILFALIFLTIGILPGLYQTIILLKNNFDLYLVFRNKIVDLYQLKRLGLSLGYIGLIIVLYKAGIGKPVLNMFAKVGQMALTNYFFQTIFCTFIFFGYGLGYFGSMQRYELYYVVAGIWIAEILFTLLWLQYFYMGPVEWLWKSLTYKKKLPLKKKRFNNQHFQKPFSIYP